MEDSIEVSEDGVSRLLRILTQGANNRGKARWVSRAQSYQVMPWGRASWVCLWGGEQEDLHTHTSYRPPGVYTTQLVVGLTVLW